MTDLPNQLQLHPHSPDTLLPLLAAHLPYSLGVYGTLVSAPRGEHTVAWATFSSETVPIPRVSVSRSDASSSIGPGLEGAWTVIVPYAGSGSHQTRIYCSYEHPSSRSGRARGTHTSETNLDAAVKPPHESGAASEGAGSGQADDEDKERKEGIDRALQQVLAVFRAYSAQVDPDFRIAGCVHSLWAPALEDMWAVEVGERRGYCGAWLRRGDNSKRLLQGDRLVREEVQGADASEGIVGEQAKMEQINGALDGYEVRLGTENDVESFIEHTDIKRPATYYTSRLSLSAVLTHRPPSVPSSPAHLESGSSSIAEGGAKVAAQVLTHADGTIGSLYTFPSYRRRGLGKELVRRHMASGRGVIPNLSREGCEGEAEGEEGWAWTHIFHGNTGSEAVFRSLGFESMWDVAWVYRRG